MSKIEHLSPEESTALAVEIYGSPIKRLGTTLDLDALHPLSLRRVRRFLGSSPRESPPLTPRSMAQEMRASSDFFYESLAEATQAYERATRVARTEAKTEETEALQKKVPQKEALPMTPESSNVSSLGTSVVGSSCQKDAPLTTPPLPRGVLTPLQEEEEEHLPELLNCFSPPLPSSDLKTSIRRTNHNDIAVAQALVALTPSMHAKKRSHQDFDDDDYDDDPLVAIAELDSDREEGDNIYQREEDDEEDSSDDRFEEEDEDDDGASRFGEKRSQTSSSERSQKTKKKTKKKRKSDRSPERIEGGGMAELSLPLDFFNKETTADDRAEWLTIHRRAVLGHSVAVPASWFSGLAKRDGKTLLECTLRALTIPFHFTGSGSRIRNSHRFAFELVPVNTHRAYDAAVSDLLDFFKVGGIDPPNHVFTSPTTSRRSASLPSSPRVLLGPPVPLRPPITISAENDDAPPDDDAPLTPLEEEEEDDTRSIMELQQ